MGMRVMIETKSLIGKVEPCCSPHSFSIGNGRFQDGPVSLKNTVDFPDQGICLESAKVVEFVSAIVVAEFLVDTPAHDAPAGLAVVYIHKLAV
jgi:hypothetical protein